MSDTFYGSDFGALDAFDPEIAAVLVGELERLRGGLQLIASENMSSPEVLTALGSTLSNKYAEGYPGRRYYGGCVEVDKAETLAIVAYQQPVSRPEIARIRGVSSESAVQSLSERGLIEESGRSRFGAAIYRTSLLFEKVFGLDGIEALPDPSRFDPTPEDERDIRERLLAAGEQRAEQ